MNILRCIINKITLFNHFLRSLHSFRSYIQFQLIATIVSLPILNAWGLPISVASLVGNMVLTPFLALFLLCSSFVFFLDLIGFSNSWTVWCLETIAFIWYWFMDHSPNWAVLCLPAQPIWLLIVLPLATALIMQCTHSSSHWLRLASCTLFLTLFFIYARVCMPPQNGIIIIPYHKKNIHLVYHNSSSCLIDTGALGCKRGTSIEYTLVPEIRKIIGTSKIDHLILTKPGIFLFDAVALLSEIFEIKQVHLIYWNDPENNKQLGACYWNMVRCLEINKTNLVRFGLYDHIINLNSECCVRITSLPGVARRNSLSWNHLLITAQIDKAHRELYDTSKHK